MNTDNAAAACQIKLIGTMKLSTLFPEQEHSTEPFNRLTTCPSCQTPFKDPVTLCCGYTLCYDCIPTTQFQCPSFTCLRIHDYPEKHIDITLRTLLTTQQLQPCSICLNSFQDPITTECGHTFCKECLIHTITHHNACPLCRHTLTRIGQVNQILARWTTQQPTQYIPEVPVLETPPIPLNQACLFRISGSSSVFKEMAEFPYQPHYAVCVSKENTVLLRIDHLEYSADTRTAVIQAYSLRTIIPSF